MMTRASNGRSVGGECLVDGDAERRRGVHALEGRPEVEEFAEPGVLEPVGLPAEVAQARRGLGADDGDPDELLRGGEALVPLVEPFVDEPLPDAGQLRGEVAEGIGRVHVLDDQVEAIEGIESDPRQAEDLDVLLEALARRRSNFAVMFSAWSRQMIPLHWESTSPRSSRSASIR